MRHIPNLIMFIVLLGVGVLNFRIAHEVDRQAIAFREDTLRRLTYSAQLNSDQADSHALMMQIIATDSPRQRAAYQAELRGYRERVDKVQREYEADIPSDQVDVRQAVEEFVKQRKYYDDVAQEALALLNAGQTEAARKFADTDLVAAYQRYNKAGDVLFDYDVASGNQHSREIEQAVARARLFTAFGFVAIFFAGVLAAFMLLRTLAVEGHV